MYIPLSPFFRANLWLSSYCYREYSEYPPTRLDRGKATPIQPCRWIFLIHSNSVFRRTAFLFEAHLNFRVVVEGTPFVLLRPSRELLPDSGAIRQNLEHAVPVQPREKSPDKRDGWGNPKIYLNGYIAR